ncbi:hypothetical protein IQ254_20705 [Nodosilinea sp. LEGE 07088]|uniref:hypothetical protein n=1 Tax=Nodosilinea sp. LEGE 07088 TaxID=2777968 RepID=UPI001882A1F1|nr:hypothetical protein [Nodosilinea sp. LEGE 07088]MBE9139588.1 hypothetical protein [Nodosilinea sp. LEGE 07088]
MQEARFAIARSEKVNRPSCGRRLGRFAVQTTVATAIAGVAAVLGTASAGLTQGYEAVPPVPAGAVPVPGAALPQTPSGDQQYLIYVTDTSEATLNQVRQVEPTAFRTTFQGQSVIQAGRFNMSGNAQQRVTDLAALGVQAETAQVAAAIPYYAQTAPLPSNVYASTGNLPPLPDAALAQTPGSAGVPVPTLPPASAQVPPAPGNVEFGQELNYSTPTTGIPTEPPSGAVMPPPTSAPPTSSPTSAPFYVVIPTDTEGLGTVSNQVIQLGTPPDRVQQRTSPRGPHVAVGPFSDRGLANRWNDFYRDAGLSNSRVFYER